jgi:hypothetical protein
MFGRRFTRKGWVQLSALALVVLIVLIILVAPMATITIRIDLPPATAKPEPVKLSDWLTLFALLVGAPIAAILLFGLPLWLVIRTASRIIRAQPRAEL